MSCWVGPPCEIKQSCTCSRGDDVYTENCVLFFLRCAGSIARLRGKLSWSNVVLVGRSDSGKNASPERPRHRNTICPRQPLYANI